MGALTDNGDLLTVASRGERSSIIATPTARWRMAASTSMPRGISSRPLRAHERRNLLGSSLRLDLRVVREIYGGANYEYAGKYRSVKIGLAELAA